MLKDCWHHLPPALSAAPLDLARGQGAINGVAQEIWLQLGTSPLSKVKRNPPTATSSQLAWRKLGIQHSIAKTHVIRQGVARVAQFAWLLRCSKCGKENGAVGCCFFWSQKRKEQLGLHMDSRLRVAAIRPNGTISTFQVPKHAPSEKCHWQR